MTETESKDLGSTVKKARKRRWPKWVFIPLAIVFALYAFFQLALVSWRDSLPPDAPRIAFSVDDTWLVELGIMTAQYEQAFARAGGRLVRFEYDEAGTPEVDPARVAALLHERKIDGVLLSGGGDVDPLLYGGETSQALAVNRVRDDFEIALIQAAKDGNLPILGICRGCQILNVALGGTLRSLRIDEALKESHFGVSGHAVDLTKDSTLAEVFAVTRLDKVHSFHGQAVGTLGKGVKASATWEGTVVEAIEVSGEDGDSWIVAVQWHPELAVTDELQNRLFHAFVERAREARQRRLATRDSD